MTEPKCSVCGKVRRDHADMIHTFRNGSTHLIVDKRSMSNDSLKGDLPSQIDPYDALGGDPALRIALLNKGIITLDELADIERQLKTGIVYGEVHSTGDNREDSEEGGNGPASGGVRDIDRRSRQDPPVPVQQRLF